MILKPNCCDKGFRRFLFLIVYDIWSCDKCQSFCITININKISRYCSVFFLTLFNEKCVFYICYSLNIFRHFFILVKQFKNRLITIKDFSYTTQVVICETWKVITVITFHRLVNHTHFFFVIKVLLVVKFKMILG